MSRNMARKLAGCAKVQWSGRVSVALGVMVQRVWALWFSAFVRCGSALIRAASSVVGWVHWLWWGALLFRCRGVPQFSWGGSSNFEGGVPEF